MGNPSMTNAQMVAQAVFGPRNPIGRAVGQIMDEPVRFGVKKTIPALAGVGSNPREPLELYGSPNRTAGFMRWKMTLAVDRDTSLNMTQSVSGLFFVTTSVDNSSVTTIVEVQNGDAAIIYRYGTSIDVSVANLNSAAIIASIMIDNNVPGISQWTVSRRYSNLTVVPVSMTIPNFSRSFEVFTTATTNGAILRGYSGNPGVLVYNETLAAPRSGEINRAPNMVYTLEAPPAPHPGIPELTVVNFCVG